MEFLHSLAEMEGHAVRLMVGLHRRTELRAEWAQHRLRVVRRHRDLAAELARGGRDLAADEAGADDQEGRPRCELLAQVQRILGGAQHPGLRAGHRQMARSDAGSDDESVEGIRRVVDHDHALSEGAAGDGRPEAPVDVVVLAPEEQALDLDAALEGLLRQGRTVVGEVDLLPDDHHVEALCAQ